MTQRFYENLLLNPEIHVSYDSEDGVMPFMFSACMGETNPAWCPARDLAEHEPYWEQIDMGSPSESAISLWVNLGLSLKLPCP